MANLPRSLSCRISWGRVLQALGIEPDHVTVLPQTVRCSICQSGQLYVLRDPTLDGEWVHCRACRFSGDLIELAAATWDVEVPTAIAKLDELGFTVDPIGNDDVIAYVRDHVQYRTRFKEFWNKASLSPMKQANPSVRNLLRIFGLYEAVRSPHWTERAGRFVGSASHTEVEELFAPLSYEPRLRQNHNDKQTKRRGGGPGNRRLFRGHGWEDVLVIPYFDLPGRISGFMFVGREADPDAGDYVFKRANLGYVGRRVREAGVAMLGSLDDGPHREFGDTVFVMSDPVVGFLLQARHLREHIKALPILLSYHSQQIQTLELPTQLDGRRLIFWGEHSRLLYQAKRWDGLVSRRRISLREVQQHRLNHRPSLEWLRLIHEHAEPWHVALQRELRELDLSSAEELLKRMEFTPAELRAFASGSVADVRERLEHCDPFRLGQRRVIVAGKAIVESEHGWEIEKTGERICNMPLRIDEILTTDSGNKYYRGFVSTASTQAQFTLDAAAVERRGLFPCVHDELIEQKVGVLNFQPKWSKHAACIAMELSPPRIVACADRIGWNKERRAFMFPNFSIEYGGKVRVDNLPVVGGEDVPARHLEPPGLPNSRCLEATSAKSVEVSILWAMMACIIHNLLAKAMNRQPCGIILDGEGAQSTGRMIARALGCAEVDMSSRRGNTCLLDRIDETCSRHGWPTVVRMPESSRLRVNAQWIESIGMHNAILALNDYAGPAVASHAGFARIQSHAAPAPLGELRMAAATLVPAYIQYTCKRKLWIDQTTEHERFNILKDIAEWHRQRGGDTSAVLAARHVLSMDNLAPPRSFIDL